MIEDLPTIWKLCEKIRLIGIFLVCRVLNVVVSIVIVIVIVIVTDIVIVTVLFIVIFIVIVILVIIIVGVAVVVMIVIVIFIIFGLLLPYLLFLSHPLFLLLPPLLLFSTTIHVIVHVIIIVTVIVIGAAIVIIVIVTVIVIIYGIDISIVRSLRHFPSEKARNKRSAFLVRFHFVLFIREKTKDNAIIERTMYLSSWWNRKTRRVVYLQSVRKNLVARKRRPRCKEVPRICI